MSKSHIKRNQQHRNYLHEISKKRAREHSTIPVPRQISNKNNTKPLIHETIFYLHCQPPFCLPTFDYGSRLLLLHCTDDQHWAIGHGTSASEPVLETQVNVYPSCMVSTSTTPQSWLTLCFQPWTYIYRSMLSTIPTQRLRVHVIVKHFQLLLSHTFSFLFFFNQWTATVCCPRLEARPMKLTQFQFQVCSQCVS